MYAKSKSSGIRVDGPRTVIGGAAMLEVAWTRNDKIKLEGKKTRQNTDTRLRNMTAFGINKIVMIVALLSVVISTILSGGVELKIIITLRSDVELSTRLDTK